MTWKVKYHKEFAKDIHALPENVRERLRAILNELKLSGPNLGRPNVDTLKGSRIANLKELRVIVPDGDWRITFLFRAKVFQVDTLFVFFNIHNILPYKRCRHGDLLHR